MGVTSTESAQFAPSNAYLTQSLPSSKGKTTASFRLSLFGMTCEPLTEDRGEALLTWYLEASRAKTSASPESVPESMERAADFGQKWRESSVKYNPPSSSWKTSQTLFEQDLPESSVTLPKWGLMLNGVVYQRRISERPISGTGFGLWHTLRASEGKHYSPNSTNPKSQRLDLHKQAMWRENAANGMTQPPPILRTLSASEDKRGAAKEIKPGRQVTLLQQLTKPHLFPTLTVCGNYNRKGASPTSGDGLATVVGGKLNPRWLEWFMGFPVGWTALHCLATRKFRRWQRLHSNY